VGRRVVDEAHASSTNAKLWSALQEVLGFVGLLHLQDPAAHTKSLSLLTDYCQKFLDGESKGKGVQGGKVGGGAEGVMLKVVLHLLQQDSAALRAVAVRGFKAVAVDSSTNVLTILLEALRSGGGRMEEDI